MTLTIKGPADDPHGMRRAEVRVRGARRGRRRAVRPLRPGTIDKTRHRVHVAGRTWEVDEFHGVLAPLVVAEVELDDPGAEVVLPSWVGTEVTGDPAYTSER
ncbi:MAG: hypothetical protein R2713_01090 [Ilumatobacteraceae bacterium]